MIGFSLKKFAREQRMTVDSGVAYGVFDGYTLTVSEGAGYKQLVFATRVTDRKEELVSYLSEQDLMQEYRVTSVDVQDVCIQIVFHDNPGTMKKIRAFLAWFTPVLREFGASGSDVCTWCGMALERGQWLLVDGCAFCLHDACKERMISDVDAHNLLKKEKASGSYLTGTLGALLGAVLGAAVWAGILYFGYVASLIGLLIGWLTEKGYSLLRGKQGKVKAVIMIVAVIFGVLLGTFGGDALLLVGMIRNGEMPGVLIGDIPWVIKLTLELNPEYRLSMIKNILMGLLFAGLGCFGIISKAIRSGADKKYKELKK